MLVCELALLAAGAQLARSGFGAAKHAEVPQEEEPFTRPGRELTGVAPGGGQLTRREEW